MKPFETYRLLHNAHGMTLLAAFWPRSHSRLVAPEARLLEIEPGTRILARCHWQAQRRLCPTLVLVHGLEGSSESGYMLGTAEIGFASGFNVLRLNQRNCGGTDSLTPTLYNSSLSGDIRAVVMELIQKDALPEVFVAGFSMGGNLVLKFAGELGGESPEQLRAVSAISPALDLAACADAVGEPRNRIYQWYFVGRLKRRMRQKARLFPGRYRLDGLSRVRSVREFDDVITAPYCGFRDADDYYARASASRVLADIRVPTLIMTAQDDPLIPFRTFANTAIGTNRFIHLVAPRYGGHCAFLSQARGDERFWAEARVIEFSREHSALERAASP